MDAFFIYVPYGPPANLSAKGLAFPRIAKVVSRMGYDFRAWRKLFPEKFEVFVLGESYFLNDFDACWAPATHFLRVLTLRYKAKFNQQKNF